MTEKTSAPRRAEARRKAGPGAATLPPAGPAPQIDEATRRHYEQGLIRRGAAVRTAPGEALPPGATHEITGTDEAGEPVIVRRRASAF